MSHKAWRLILNNIVTGISKKSIMDVVTVLIKLKIRCIYSV